MCIPRLFQVRAECRWAPTERRMLLLSGGIDSPVAGYMVAKRGVKIDAVYFHAPPYTSERAKQKVVDLAKIVSRYSRPHQSACGELYRYAAVYL